MSIRRRSIARLRGLPLVGVGMALLWWVFYVAVPNRIALAFAIAWTVVAVFWLIRLRAVRVAQQIEGDDTAPPS